MLRLNPKCRIKLSQIGQSQTKVIVIDDLLVDCQPLRTYALKQADFDHELHTYYPGRRAALPASYANTLEDFLNQLIKQVYAVKSSNKAAITPQMFSLLTRDESALVPEQCLPHYDHQSAQYFAMTHYLNPGDFSGTAFYRNRQSGIEVVNRDNIKAYTQAINQYVQQHGMFKQQYFSDSNDMFELLGVVPWQENRAVIYPGALLHSPYIDNVALNVRNSIKFGRLTANLFIDLTGQPN